MILQRETAGSDYSIIYNTLQKDTSNSEKEAVEHIYRQLRNAEPPDEATAMGIIDNVPLTLSKVDLPASDRKLTADVPVQQGLTSPAVIAQIVKKAFEIRPDIKQAEMTAEIAATGVRIAKISAGVNVTADVAARYQFDAANDPTRSIGNNKQVTLAATYPLFDGGNVKKTHVGILQESQFDSFLN